MTERRAQSLTSRRRFLVTGAAVAASSSLIGADTKAGESIELSPIIAPPEGKRILLSCKLSMIAKEQDGQPLSLANRLMLAGNAGFDGVDLDEAGAISPTEARTAVQESGVFVHNAINHAHWQDRLTSADPEVRAKGRANIEHCIRVSHAAGGSGVLIVLGRGEDGPADVIAGRCRDEVKELLPLAAAYGQMMLFENVWNRMFYDHDAPPEQSAERMVEFADSFESPWIGWYYDIGNHWKYGQPAEWIRALGRQCVKLDVKGFSRAEDKFVDIMAGDLPWDEVRDALGEIGFAGWATAEVSGGGLERLTTVRQQMETALVTG
jgi:hexulose-6-phosphate isomerase